MEGIPIDCVGEGALRVEGEVGKGVGGIGRAWLNNATVCDGGMQRLHIDDRRTCYVYCRKGRAVAALLQNRRHQTKLGVEALFLKKSYLLTK